MKSVKSSKKKGPWILLVVIALIGVLVFGRNLTFIARRPGIPVSQFDSVAIKIMAHGATEKVIEQHITDGNKVQQLLTILNTGRSSLDHKCASIGELVFTAASGNRMTVSLLPGHDQTRYEFRTGSGLFTLPRTQFIAAMEDLGVSSETIALDKRNTLD